MTSSRHERKDRPAVSAVRAAWVLFGMLVLPAVAPAPARAEMPGDVPDHWRLSLGGVAAETFTEAGLGSTRAGIGATINFEDIFDLPESKSTWRFEANWHINKRQYIDFGYFELNRSASVILDQNVEWGDFVFLANGKVTSDFKSSFPYAAWRYDFLQLPEVRISGSAGINYLSLETGLTAVGDAAPVNDPMNPVSGEVDERISIGFPVPQIGLQLDWALTRRLAVKMYLRQIYINASGIDGGIGESAMRLHWWATKNFGISGGLDKESIDLKKYTSGDTTARFRYEVRGFSFYFNLAF
jgi:hypothetical protein